MRDTGEATRLSSSRSAVDRFIGETTAGWHRLRAQWRPVVLPVLVLWVLAAIVTATLLHPFDVREYERYAHAAIRPPLLHRLPLEYPAPALLVFLVPLLLPVAYPWAFACVAGVGLVLLATSYQGADVPGWDGRAAGRLIIYLSLGSVMVVAGRYDVFAALATLWAVRAARRDRWSVAWTWASIGVALKLFPAALWPVLVIAEWRRIGRVPWRRVWWVGASIVVVAVIPALLDHHAALNALHYYLHRPAEIGSIPAGLSLLLDFHATTWVSSFHSANVTNAWAGTIGVVVELAAVAGCLWTWWAQARGRLSVQAACLATLTFVVLGSKVLSVQYLIWLMPLWALYELRVSWLVASSANLVVFPYAVTATSFGYVPTHAFAVSLTLAFFARDVLIAAGTWSWLRSVDSDERDAARAQGQPGLDEASGIDRSAAVTARA
jgi:hypothetical protein